MEKVSDVENNESTVFDQSAVFQVDFRKLDVMYLWLTGDATDTDKEGKKRKFPIRFPVKNSEQVQYIKTCMDYNVDIALVWVFSDDYSEIIKLRSWQEQNSLNAYDWNKTDLERVLDKWGDPDRPGEYRLNTAINSFNDTSDYYKNRRVVHSLLASEKKEAKSAEKETKRKKYKSFKV